MRPNLDPRQRTAADLHCRRHTAPASRAAGQSTAWAIRQQNTSRLNLKFGNTCSTDINNNILAEYADSLAIVLAAIKEFVYSFARKYKFFAAINVQMKINSQLNFVTTKLPKDVPFQHDKQVVDPKAGVFRCFIVFFFSNLKKISQCRISGPPTHPPWIS